MHLQRRIAWILAAVLFVGALAAGIGAWKGGYRAYVIHTGSMENTLVPGDLVIDRPVTDGGYHVGDTITFRHSAGPDLVTHRVHSIGPDGGIHTKGDANRTPDVWVIAPSMVHGVVQLHVPDLGYAAVYFKQPTGIASLVTMILGLVLAWGVFFPPEESETVAAVEASDDVEDRHVLV